MDENGIEDPKQRERKEAQKLADKLREESEFDHMKHRWFEDALKEIEKEIEDEKEVHQPMKIKEESVNNTDNGSREDDWVEKKTYRVGSTC